MTIKLSTTGFVKRALLLAGVFLGLITISIQAYAFWGLATKSDDDLVRLQLESKPPLDFYIPARMLANDRFKEDQKLTRFEFRIDETIDSVPEGADDSSWLERPLKVVITTKDYHYDTGSYHVAKKGSNYEAQGDVVFENGAKKGGFYIYKGVQEIKVPHDLYIPTSSDNFEAQILCPNDIGRQLHVVDCMAKIVRPDVPYHYTIHFDPLALDHFKDVEALVYKRISRLSSPLQE